MAFEKAHVMLVSTSPAPPLRQVFSDDTLWDRLRQEAADVLAREPVLAALILTTVINRETFEQAVIHRVALRLANGTVSTDLIVDAFTAALREDPEIGKAFRADIAAVVDRDPATARLIEPLLYYKGFHAIETHRLAHYLWNINQRDLAFYLQSRSSELFQTDIHPAARFGRGIFLDHATGFVVGATAIIEDNVSILQNVTLGGTGKESGDRHPKIKSGTMIGAGAKILGNIEVGPCARVAAGSVVLSPVPANSTVAGVPAKIVGTAGCPEPARDMNQILSKLAYDSFSYSI
ncbi:serine O-acetyltransferase [Methylovirgula ligni]|uniref:Serine acetyltransferase n=2 Tax=Methylovirgula ligni TaxID=569860 RepID=A0A3D9YMI8_9HYPH|nr:serine O-acetyltransferase [Methylovirgula ligni]